MRRPYAYDENGPRLSELQDSHDKLREATAKLGELIDSGQFNFADGREHARRAMKHAADIREMLRGEAGEDIDPETDPNDVDDDVPRPSAKVNGSDGMGMVQPRPSVVLAVGSREPDHRRDFEPAAGRDRRRGRGAHDAALPKGYDPDAIFQRKEPWE